MKEKIKVWWMRIRTCPKCLKAQRSMGEAMAERNRELNAALAELAKRRIESEHLDQSEMRDYLT